jgi:hypothetical protein
MGLRWGLMVVAFGLVSAAAGCGSDGDPASGAAPPPSPSAQPSSSTPRTPGLSNPTPPTLPTPQKPPKRPTDEITGAWFTGTVTRGGTGPCYGFTDDAGRDYAIYTNRKPGFREGERVRVRLAPLEARIYCGPGEHMRLLEVK